MDIDNNMQLTSNGFLSPIVSTNTHLSSWKNWGLNLASANLNNGESFLKSVDKNQYSLLKNNSQDYPTTQKISTTSSQIGSSPLSAPSIISNTAPAISSSLSSLVKKPISGAKAPKVNALVKNSAMISSGIDTAGSLLTGLTKQSQSKLDQGISAGANAAGSALMSIPTPWTVAAGAAVKGLSYLNTSLGPTVKGTSNYDLASSSSSYTGIKKYGDQKFGLASNLFGQAGKQQAKVNKSNQQLAMAQKILQNQYDPNQSAQLFSNSYNNAITGTNSTLNSQNIFGKNGIKVKSVKELVQETKAMRKMESGGKFNVIPDGALHARLNNMSNEELEGNITKKGIPVIVKGSEGIKQIAEIEKNEIVIYKDIVNKLEQYRKDKNALEAGKLLAEEILRNTKDNTGLLKVVE